MNRLERLQQQLREALARRDTLRARILELAEGEAEFTAEQDEEYRSANTEFDALGARIEAMEGEARQLERVLAAPERSREPVGLTVHVPNREDPLADGAEYRSPREVVDTARRAIEQKNGAVELEDRHREAALRTLRSVHGSPSALARHIIATAREDYRTGFAKMVAAALRNQPVLGLTDGEVRAIEAVRAVSLTDAAGGYAVPFTLDPTIILTGAHDGTTNQWRALSRVVTTTTDSWNGVTSAGVTATRKAESAESDETTPTLTQPSIPVHRLDVFIPFTVEIEGDWASMESDLRMMIEIARDDKESAELSAQAAPAANTPPGLLYQLDGTASEVAPATAETFVVGDVYKTHDALPRRRRLRATWMAEISTYSKIRQFDTAGGGQMFGQLPNGLPSTLLDRPHVEEPNMKGFAELNTAVTADNFLLVFGDFQKHVMVDRVGLSIELVPHLFHTANNRPKGERGLWAWMRNGAEVVDVDAFRVLSIPTTA
jgi:HK97 family phage major capsid protein